MTTDMGSPKTERIRHRSNSGGSMKNIIIIIIIKIVQ